MFAGFALLLHQSSKRVRKLSEIGQEKPITINILGGTVPDTDRNRPWDDCPARADEKMFMCFVVIVFSAPKKTTFVCCFTPPALHAKCQEHGFWQSKKAFPPRSNGLSVIFSRFQSFLFTPFQSFSVTFRHFNSVKNAGID